MLSENKILLAKTEGVIANYGVDPTPTTTANFIAAHNISIRPNLTYNDTAATDGSLSPRAGTLGQKYIEATFDYELQMEKVTDWKTPPVDPLLLACGYDDTTDGTYVPYTTYPAADSSCTIYVYEEDILWIITGCRGNVVWNFSAGNPVILSFTMQGLYTKPVDSTFPSTWTDLGGSPVVAINQSFDWDSTKHPIIESLAFSLNNTLAQSPTLDDARAHGVNAIHITNRMPDCSFNPEMTKETVNDFWTHYEALTQTAIGYSVSDGTAKCTISLPKTEIMSITSGDRNGTLIYDIPARCVRTTGDDEISAVFGTV